MALIDKALEGGLNLGRAALEAMLSDPDHKVAMAYGKVAATQRQPDWDCSLR